MPPQKSSSPYITPEGAKSLRKELQYLWRGLRPEVVRALSAAAAEGDRSENAEYTYRKKQLAEIDRRVRYLSKRLDVVRVVERPPDDTGKVRFGARVTLADDAGVEVTYRVVGADETDAKRGWISIDSPVARALLGKAVDDAVTVPLPAGEARYTVIDIRYHERA